MERVFKDILFIIYMKRWIISLIIALIVVLPIAWYLASPLFINNVVNEDMPSALSEGVLAYSGNFVDADSFHKVSGEAKIVSIEGKNYLRLENFESTNGPDLKVYFSNDLDAQDYASLGELKGNIGNQNYEIPESVDFSNYKYVLIWCERFSVLFGSSELQKA